MMKWLFKKLPYRGHDLVIAKIMLRVILFLPVPTIGISISLYVMGNPFKSAILLTLLPPLLLITFLIRKGHLRVSNFILLFLVIGIITWSSAYGNGLHDLGIVAFPVCILFSCLMMRPRDLYVVAFVSALCLTLIFIGQNEGWFPLGIIYQGRFADVIVISLVIISGMLIITSITSNLKEATIEAYVQINEQKKLQALFEDNLKEKEDLFREVHHRVKNHLSFINSLIDLQQMDDLNIDRKQLRELQGRIVAVARVHDQLYQSDNYSLVHTKKYLESICSQFLMTYQLTECRSEMKFEDFPFAVNKVIYLGLCLHEIIRSITVQQIKPHKIEFILTKATRKTILTIIFDHEAKVRYQGEGESTELLYYLVEKLDGTIEIIGGERKGLIEMEF